MLEQLYLNRSCAVMAGFEYDLFEDNSFKFAILFALLISLFVDSEVGFRIATDLDFDVKLRQVRWDTPSITEVFRCIFYKMSQKNNQKNKQDPNAMFTNIYHVIYAL